MPAPQFNKRRENVIWYSLTYQSNNLLNEATHNTVKALVAEDLITNCGVNVVEIHSYIHGNIIFSLPNGNTDRNFDNIVNRLNTRWIAGVPPLLFNLSSVGIGQDAPHTNYMYIHGDDNLNVHFKASIQPLLTRFTIR